MDRGDPVRVLVADDHALVRRGIVRILRGGGEIEVVGEAGDGAEAIRRALETKPDVVVMDLSLPTLSGFEAARQFRAALPQTRILVLTMHDEDEYIAGSLRAGASGYLLKDEAPAELVSGIRALKRREFYFAPSTFQALARLCRCRGFGFAVHSRAIRGGSMRYTAGERQALIQRYEEGPTRLRDAFAKVPREAWKWRPDDGKWSVYEVVCHCADAEMNAAARIRYLVAEEKPAIAGFDQDRWARVLDYHSAKIELALAAVDVMRAHTVNLLRQLPEEAWSAEGTHSESGRYTAEDWLTIYAEHLEKHARQIERTLEAWRAEQTKPS